jgi:hypothetical protein
MNQWCPKGRQLEEMAGRGVYVLYLEATLPSNEEPRFPEAVGVSKRDVRIAGSYGTAEHHVRRRRVRDERGGRGSTVVSRGNFASAPGTRAGGCILPEGGVGNAVSGSFRMQRSPPRRR